MLALIRVRIFEVESKQSTEEALHNYQNPAAEMGRYGGVPLAYLRERLAGGAYGGRLGACVDVDLV